MSTTISNVRAVIQSRLTQFSGKVVAGLRRRPKTAIFAVVLGLVWLFCLPRPLFQKPLSTVLEDRTGLLLGARIAQDGQWRFPGDQAIPEKYTTCVVNFEDKRFWYHPGVDPLSLFRAMWLNVIRVRRLAARLLEKDLQDQIYGLDTFQ